MGNIDILTIVIIGANILFSMKGFNDLSFFNKYKFQISSIQQGEKVRMLSSGFLHANQQHLFFNMFTLYIFANFILFQTNGRLNFIIIYLGSLIAGSVFALIFHKKEPFYSAVGASGAVMGIVYASVLMNPRIEIYFLPGWVFAIGFFAYSIYGIKKSIGNIGHSAHLGGAIGGYVLTLILKPSVFETNKMLVIALAIPIVLLYVFKDKLK